jgi:DNA (cytosine-5)-methyltransferase 1
LPSDCHFRYNVGWGLTGFIALIFRLYWEANLSLTAVSLFSGCGGFCEGMSLAGFKVNLAVESDRFACENYKFNFPENPLFEGNIEDFASPSGGRHAEIFGIYDVDLIFGSPPRPSASRIEYGVPFDGRIEGFQEYVRIVGQLRPKAFLVEVDANPMMVNAGYFRDVIIGYFVSIGYSNTTYLTASATEFGVPQTRECIIIFGARDDCVVPFELKSFAMTALSKHRVEPPVTVAEAIGDLPRTVVPSGSVMEYQPAGKLSPFMREMRLDVRGRIYTRSLKRRRGIAHMDKIALHNHHTREIENKRLKIIELLEPGVSAGSLPKEIWHGERPEKLRRLHQDLPSYAVSGQMHNDLSKWVHPSEQRWITVREAARLQSFHDGFVFKCSETQMLKQIGNAVPPLLARAMGLMMAEVLHLTGV